MDWDTLRWVFNFMYREFEEWWVDMRGKRFKRHRRVGGRSVRARYVVLMGWIYDESTTLNRCGT